VYPRRPFAAAFALIFTVTGCGGSGGGTGGETAKAPAAAPDGGAPSPELQAQLRNDAGLRGFYEGRQWSNAWDERSGRSLEEALGNAVRHGLDPQDYLRPVHEARDPIAREAALTRAALAYAGALAHGKVDPRRLFPTYALPRNEVDLNAGLNQAIQRGNVGEWLESLAPQDEDYRALSAAYVQALQAPQPQPAQPPENGKQRPPRPQPARTATPTSPRDQAVVLAVNLERRRWLARDVPPTRVDVNTAATFLRYFRDNQQVDRRVVVNGQPGWETPQLGSPIVRLVANPNWTVPRSIENNELGRLSEAALQRRHMSRRNGRIVQEPGPSNALGQVKLDMQNDQAIYLHDTPSKWAFQRNERHLSHGCVRVNDAVGFARIIADSQGKAADLDHALRDPKKNTIFIQLAQAIPVRLLYFTAFFDNGQVVFAPDPYGWDAKVAEALGLPIPAASAANRTSADRARQQREGDVGP
jgi:L,D-transpeptidase YcbB